MHMGNKWDFCEPKWMRFFLALAVKLTQERERERELMISRKRYFWRMIVLDF